MKSLLPAAGILFLAAAGAAAQTAQSAGRAGQMNGVCGQPLALTYTLAMPLDLVAAAPLDAAFLRAEPFYLEFTLTAPARVAAATDSARSDADPYLTIFDAGGGVLAMDDDGAGSLDARIDTVLDPGTYCVQVRPVTGSDTTQEVTLRLAAGTAAEELAARSVDAPEADGLCSDPALTADLDRPLGPGGGRFSLQTTVDPQGRRDWRLTVTEATELQIDASSAQFDTMLRLLDAAGSLVAENDDAFGTNTDSRLLLSAAPGTYCLSLSGYDGGAGLAELTVTDTPEAPPAGPIGRACSDPRITADFGAAMAPGVGDHLVTGRVPPGSRSDWRFEVGAATRLQIDAGSDEFDTMLSLVDAGGHVVEQNDDGPVDTDSRITRMLAPGMYCLAVEGYGGAGGTFRLSATDRPDADPPADTAAGFCMAPETTSGLDTGLAPGFGDLVLPTRLTGAHQDLAFEVTAETALRIEARSAEFDTVLRLATADGMVLAENDDGPAGTDSSMDHTLAPGSYCLRLESFGGSHGAAELTLSERGGAAVPADLVAQGLAVPDAGSDVEIEDLGVLGDRIEANRLSEAQTKWVAFTVGSDTAVRIDGVALGGAFALRLFTEAGEMVGEARATGGLSPARLEHHLPAGRYLLAVALDPQAGSRLRNVSITRIGG